MDEGLSKCICLSPLLWLFMILTDGDSVFYFTAEVQSCSWKRTWNRAGFLFRIPMHRDE
jgi:hypothetical protein